MEDMDTNKQYILWLEERSEKLRQLENIILNLQYSSNDKPKEDRLNHDELKMEVFKLWYFVTYGKKYNL